MKVAGSPAVLTLLSHFDATPLPDLIDILSPPPAPISARLERGFMSEGRWFPCLSDSTTPLRHYFPSRSHRYHSPLRLHLPVIAVSCTLHNAPWTLDFAPCTLDFVLCTLDLSLCTLDFVLCTLHLGLWNFDLAPCTLDFGLWTCACTRICTCTKSLMRSPDPGPPFTFRTIKPNAAGLLMPSSRGATDGPPSACSKAFIVLDTAPAST